MAVPLGARGTDGANDDGQVLSAAAHVRGGQGEGEGVDWRVQIRPIGIPQGPQGA